MLCSRSCSVRFATSDGSQRALCLAAMLILMAMPPGLQGCCCGRHRHGDSSAASSEEDAVASGDARLQRCVRTVAPNLIVDGSYAYVAKIDSCAARGMDALAGGATPAEAADVIAACVNDLGLPPALAPFAEDFKDCARRVLT